MSAPPKRPYLSAARQARLAQTRGKILDAATRLSFGEHAWDVSVPAIARAAGVSVRTVYHHFPDKAAVFDAIARRRRRLVAHVLDDELASLAPGSESRLAGLLHVLTAPSAVQILTGQYGMDEDEANRCVHWALETLVGRARDDGRVDA